MRASEACFPVGKSLGCGAKVHSQFCSDWLAIQMLTLVAHQGISYIQEAMILQIESCNRDDRVKTRLWSELGVVVLPQRGGRPARNCLGNVCPRLPQAAGLDYELILFSQIASRVKSGFLCGWCRGRCSKVCWCMGGSLASCVGFLAFPYSKRCRLQRRDWWPLAVCATKARS